MDHDTPLFAIQPSILAGCAVLLGGYFVAVGPARERLGRAGAETSATRVACWVAGVGVLFAALNGPLHEWSDHYLFSAHMAQHLLIMLVMPPFLILGLPPWLIGRALEVGSVRSVARVLTHPAVAFVAYNVTFVVWHLPKMYGTALENHDIHIVQHLTFMSASVMMWWPVVNPVEELERIPTGPLLMAYLFFTAIPGTIVSILITLSDDVVYPFYAAAPRISALSALEDQRLGGLIMWIPGMLVFWVAISGVFFRWTKDEYRAWRLDPEAPSPL